MGKYAPLTTHLRSLEADSWTASFAELEGVLGFPLPPSARTYQAWWSPAPTHTHTRGWTDAGWKVEKLDLPRTWVMFVPAAPRSAKPARRQGSVPLYRPINNRAAPQTPTVAEPNLTAGTVSVTVQFAWQLVGEVKLDASGDLQFPAVEDQAGLYRLEFAKDGITHAYIGETDRLRRRFYHYRNPGPSQQTNIRLNALLRQAIGSGANVIVSVLQHRPQLQVGEWSRTCDLLVKSERVLLEHAALLALRQGGATALNI
jgi:hypothetical protein